MRIFIASLLLFLAVQGAPQVQTGAIEGKVVRASNSVPISGVQITLIPPAPPGQPGAPATTGATTPGTTIQVVRTPEGVQVTQTAPNGAVSTQIVPLEVFAAGNFQLGGATLPQNTVVTDGDGKFSFRNLAPGNYTIRAQRDGYFGPISPQGTYPGAVTKSISVESDRTASVELGMVQGGVLRGILRDPDGQPAPNYAVVIARPGYNNGRYIWLLAGARNADDRGEYRWPGLAPGEYYVGSGPRAPGPIANVQDSWARVFAPGVIDPNQARPVTLAEGGETTVNLNAVLKPWSVYKISGVALNPLPNLPPDPTTGNVSQAVTTLVLMPLDLRPMDNPPVSSWTGTVAISTKPNGEYQLTNVDPGRYDLYAMARDIPNRRIWTGRVRVEVQDKDITGLNITVSPGVTVQGEVAFTGPTTTFRPEAVRIQLQTLGSLPPEVANAVGAIPVDASGKFQITNLAEGRYRMSVGGLPAGAYVASIQQGGKNVFDEGFTADTQEAQAPIRVEINMGGETVEGNVRTALKEAPNAMVVLVPEAARRNNPAFYKAGLTDDKGHFIIRGVAPGAYTIFAWESVLPGAYQNAEFLEKNLSRGRALTVQGGTRSDITLDLIRTN
jgi:protocatechuate 3,4-dioxygenase beta subunit